MEILDFLAGIMDIMDVINAVNIAVGAIPEQSWLIGAEELFDLEDPAAVEYVSAFNGAVSQGQPAAAAFAVEVDSGAGTLSDFGDSAFAAQGSQLLFNSAVADFGDSAFAAQGSQLLFNSAVADFPAEAAMPAAVSFAALGGMTAFYSNTVNDAYGLTLDFGGMLGGAFVASLAAPGNAIAALCNSALDNGVILWNYFADLAGFFANVWTDPLGAVVRAFAGAFDAILSIVESAADALGGLLGQELGGGIGSFRDRIGEAVEQSFGTGIEVIPKLNNDALRLDHFDYGEAFETGYRMFGAGEPTAASASVSTSVSSAVSAAVVGFAGYWDYPDHSNYSDYSEKFSEVYSRSSDIFGDVSRTAEELSYLRDIAEQETVNRFTTAEVRIEQINHNNISSALDLDGILSGLTDAVDEAAGIITEGVHA